MTAALRRHPQLLLLAALVGVLALTTPSFATAANLLNVTRQVSVITIISCGLTLVVIGGWLDLSIGSVFSLAGVVSVSLQPRSPLLAVLVPVAVCVLIGVANGGLVAWFEANSIVVTLGTLSLVAGLALMYTNGAVITAVPDGWYAGLAKGQLLHVPGHVVVAVALAVAFELLLAYTTFGRGLVYVGTNPEAARIAGVPLARTTVLVFALSGLSVGLASIIQASRLLSASPVAGVGLEFDAITAIVIGGVSLRGGRGHVYDTVLGVLLLAVIVNALTLYNVPYGLQNIAKGAMVLVAIGADARWRRRVG